MRHAATGSLVVVLRTDHLADLAANRDFAGIVERGLHLMAATREDELRPAIVEPARLAGLSVEPALVQAPSRIPTSAEFLPDGKDVLIATSDRAVYRWDPRVYAVRWSSRVGLPAET